MNEQEALVASLQQARELVKRLSDDLDRLTLKAGGVRSEEDEQKSLLHWRDRISAQLQKRGSKAADHMPVFRVLNPRQITGDPSRMPTLEEVACFIVDEPFRLDYARNLGRVRTQRVMDVMQSIAREVRNE